MEKISGILKPSSRPTWKFDVPSKAERLTDPREAEGFDRNNIPVRDPKLDAQKEIQAVPEANRELLENPMKGAKLNTIA